MSVFLFYEKVEIFWQPICPPKIIALRPDFHSQILRFVWKNPLWSKIYYISENWGVRHQIWLNLKSIWLARHFLGMNCHQTHSGCDPFSLTYPTSHSTLCGLFGTKFRTVIKWRCQRVGLPSTQNHETLKADPTGHERIIPHHLYKIKVLGPQRYWPICRSRNL